MKSIENRFRQTGFTGALGRIPGCADKLLFQHSPLGEYPIGIESGQQLSPVAPEPLQKQSLLLERMWGKASSPGLSAELEDVGTDRRRIDPQASAIRGDKRRVGSMSRLELPSQRKECLAEVLAGCFPISVGPQHTGEPFPRVSALRIKGQIGQKCARLARL